MINYSLTDAQKELLRSLVGYVRAGKLGRDFIVIECQDPRKAGAFICSIDLDNGSSFEFEAKSDLELLCKHDPPLVHGRWNTTGTTKIYSITQDGLDAVESDFYPFKDILIDSDQEDLLIKIVEAARNVPSNQRTKFIVAQSVGGDCLIHPGLPKEKGQIYYGDVEMLAREELLVLSRGSGGTPRFDIAPLGFRHYEYLKRRAGDAVGRMESTMRSFLDAHEFQQRYPEAYRKWSLAEELLWRTDTEQQLTTIGHLCREALQEFTTALVDLYKPLEVIDDKAKTWNRLQAVLDVENQRFGSTERPFPKALLEYFKTVDQLIQRQEHGALKEGEKLVWEDARRVVFHAAVVMFEIDRAVQI